MTQQEALIALEKSLKDMNSTPMGRRLFLASSSLLLAACATQDNHRLREGDNAGQNTEMSVEDEMKMTAEVLPTMKKDYPPLQNADVQNYIKGLGHKIVKANNLVGNPYNYSFTAVDIGMVNAFALPAGTVFVTAPLIAMADTEAELAGVIGHEVGHIKARHTAERMEAAKKAEGKTAWYAGGGALLGAALGYGASKILCKPEDKECLQKSVMYGAGAGAAGGLLIQKYKFMANSREDEMEADRIGFRTSVNANYNKDQAGLFYEKLLKMEQSRGQGGNDILRSLSDAMSTHPPSAERVQQMKQMAQSESNKANAITSTKEFDRIKKICIELNKKYQDKAKS